MTPYGEEVKPPGPVKWIPQGWLIGTWRADHKRTIVTIPQDQAFTVTPRITNSEGPGGYGGTVGAERIKEEPKP